MLKRPEEVAAVEGYLSRYPVVAIVGARRGIDLPFGR